MQGGSTGVVYGGLKYQVRRQSTTFLFSRLQEPPTTLLFSRLDALLTSEPISLAPASSPVLSASRKKTRFTSSAYLRLVMRFYAMVCFTIRTRSGISNPAPTILHYCPLFTPLVSSITVLLACFSVLACSLFVLYSVCFALRCDSVRLNDKCNHQFPKFERFVAHILSSF